MSKLSTPIITDLINVRDDGAVSYQKRVLIVSDLVMDVIRSWHNYIMDEKKLLKMKK